MPTTLSTTTRDLFLVLHFYNPIVHSRVPRIMVQMAQPTKSGSRQGRANRAGPLFVPRSSAISAALRRHLRSALELNPIVELN